MAYFCEPFGIPDTTENTAYLYRQTVENGRLLPAQGGEYQVFSIEQSGIMTLAHFTYENADETPSDVRFHIDIDSHTPWDLACTTEDDTTEPSFWAARFSFGAALPIDWPGYALSPSSTHFSGTLPLSLLPFYIDQALPLYPPAFLATPNAANALRPSEAAPLPEALSARTVQVHGTIAEVHRQHLNGMFLYYRMILNTEHGAITVPISADTPVAASPFKIGQRITCYGLLSAGLLL